MYNWKLIKTLNVIEEVENTMYPDIDTWQSALSQLFDIAPYGIACDIEDFVIDEDGEVTPHSLSEYKEFFEQVSQELYNIFIREEYRSLQNKEQKQIQKEILDKVNLTTRVETRTKEPAFLEQHDIDRFFSAIKIPSKIIKPNEYMNEYGPGIEYAHKICKERKDMEELTLNIEKKYKDKVKCFLTDWNEEKQWGCILYVYIL